MRGRLGDVGEIVDAVALVRCYPSMKSGTGMETADPDTLIMSLFSRITRALGAIPAKGQVGLSVAIDED